MNRVTYYMVDQELEAYQSMVVALPQSMFLLDRDKRIIGIFNAAAETLAGIPVEQIVGRNILDFANDPESPLHQACSMLNTTFDPVFKTGNPLTFQYMVLDTYFEATITKIPGDRILSQVRDITDIVTEQRKIEEKKHNELSMAMVAGGLVSWSYDVQERIVSSTQDNNVVEPDMPLDKLLSQIHPDFRQATADMFDNIIRHGSKLEHITVPVKNRTGATQWSDVHAIPHEYGADGQVTTIIGSQKDITPEHEYNEKLRKLVVQNELILNNTNSGLVYLTPDLKVEWENVTSLFTDPFLTAMVDDVGKLEESVCQIVRQAADSKERAMGKIFTPDGMVTECIAQPVLTSGGELEGVVLRIDDVTEKERALGALAEAKEMAEQSDKLKSAFLANMSHEIRTPLNSIVGFAQLIPGADNKEELQSYIDVVNSNSELLLNLINDILDLSKIEAGFINRNDKIFNLPDLFTELGPVFRHRMRGEVELVCDIPYKEYLVKLDRVRMVQLVSNFMTNAVKFTKQGRITMGFSLVPQGVRLYVTDTGCGMSPEQARRVFDRFEKFNRFEQGTGLGTSIAKAIVDAYDGRIGVDSEPGKGSTFWAELPVSADLNCKVGTGPQDAAPAASAGAEPQEEAENSPPRILIAEDNDSNFMLIRILLKGFDVTRAVNGLEAVEAAQSGEFDIVLMDIRMPVMDGLEATQRIRSFNSEIPIVAVTANAFDEERRRAYEAGVNDFMAKPLNKPSLLAMLDRFLHLNPPAIGSK